MAMRSRTVLALLAASAAASPAMADTTGYTYDALGRMTASAANGGSVVNTTIGYDAAGNRSSYQVTGGSNGTFTTMAVNQGDDGHDGDDPQMQSPAPMSDPVIAPYLQSLAQSSSDTSSGN